MKHLIGAFLLLSLSAFLLSKLIIGEVNKEKNNYKLKIGYKVLVDKDTLSIVDYSTFNETFTLSNGMNVSVNYVDSNLVKK